ncbi:MAG: CDP-alcohol phosphatidyltransferase family protein [Gammaproteobacteria bacterium]
MTGEEGANGTLVKLRRQLQRFFAGILAPLVNWLDARGVRPDQVTWAGFDMAVLAAFFAAFRLFTIAGILFALSGIADLVDGALARRGERVSNAGAFLDSVLDRGGEALLHIGAAVAFAWWGMWLGVLAVTLSLAGSHLTSYARARAEALGAELEAVWFGRGERIVVLSVGLIFHFALITFWIVAIASWAAAIHRIWLARARLAPATKSVAAEFEDTTEDDSDDQAGA